MYDYLIVGAGPCGLTLAWILGKAGKSVLLLEREQSIGGCHRVRRVNGFFTEHGPRVYMSNANTFRNFLNKMGLEFDSMFTPYNFNFTGVGGDSLKILKPGEIFALVIAYMGLVFNPSHGKQINMQDFMVKHNFTKKTMIWIDNICRLTDGAGIDRYTLFEFLHLANQHAFHQIVQPKRPNDVGLFRSWKHQLDQLPNVRILLQHEVTEIEAAIKGQITGLKVVNMEGKLMNMRASNYIFAIPPEPFVTLLMKSQIPEIRDSYGPLRELQKWEKNSKYITYIPVTFHWNKNLKLPKVWGFPRTPWGIAFVVLSDYMKFDNPESQTVISTCITRVNVPATLTKKTAHECTEGELIDEVFEQLKMSYPDLPDPTQAILSPGVHRKHRDWITKDASFILSTSGFQNKIKSKTVNNLYWIGTHSGKSKYNFTSIESAVSNGVYLANHLVPESKNDYSVKAGLELIHVIQVVMVAILAIMIFLFFKNRSK